MFIGVDGDDTLWPTGRLYMDAIQGLAEACGGWDALASRHAGNIDVFGAGALPLLMSMIEAALAAPPGTQDIRETAAAAAASVRAIHEDPAEPFDGAAEALEALRSDGHTLALVTRGTSAEQTRKLRRSGLDRFFGGLVCLAWKDETAYRSLVAGQAGRPGGFAMVGDKWSEDAAPVIAAGGKAVLVLNGAPAPVEAAGSGAEVIETIAGLPEAIKRLAGQPADENKNVGEEPRKPRTRSQKTRPARQPEQPEHSEQGEPGNGQNPDPKPGPAGETGADTAPGQDRGGPAEPETPSTRRTQTDDDRPAAHPALRPGFSNKAAAPESAHTKNRGQKLDGRWHKLPDGGFGVEVSGVYKQNDVLEVIVHRKKTAHTSERVIQIFAADPQEGVSRGLVINEAGEPEPVYGPQPTD